MLVRNEAVVFHSILLKYIQGTYTSKFNLGFSEFSEVYLVETLFRFKGIRNQTPILFYETTGIYTGWRKKKFTCLIAYNCVSKRPIAVR